MTAFGHQSHTYSPARQRIDAAGRSYQNGKRRVLAALSNRVAEMDREAAMADAAQKAARYLYEGPLAEAAMGKIVNEVSRRLGISVGDILGVSRLPEFVRARHECFWRSREETRFSFPRIGKFFHRDHTTVLSGCRKHAELIRAGAA